MGHNLEVNENGKASMMYTGEAPWHGLGQYLGENAVTSEEALVAANMDWEVRKENLYHGNVETYMKDIYDYKAIIREDTGNVLSIMKKTYTPFQNKEAFAILDPFIGENKAVWHTAGVLGIGGKIWVLAKLPGTIEVTKDDIVDKYFLLTNSHDGSYSIQLLFTPVRVVCQNTLNMALIGEGSDIVKIKHTKNYKMRLDEAMKILGLVDKKAEEFGNTAKEMFELKMSDKQIDQYLIDILKISKEGKEKAELYKNKNFIKNRDLVESGIGTDIPGVKGSLWGVYNAVTEGVDHCTRKVKDKVNYIWFGAGKDIKDRAWNEAKKLI